MTDQEIEAARIAQGIPEGSMWMGDGWCPPDVAVYLTAQIKALEAKWPNMRLTPTLQAATAPASR